MPPLPAVPLRTRRQCLQGGAAWLCAAPGLGRAAPPDEFSDPEASPIWQRLRAQQFGERAPQAAPPARWQLQAPRRAADPAFVPLATAGSLEAVRRVWLVIDQNPSPLAALFELPPGGAGPELETRVRVDEYSFVRAIAEQADGQRWQALRHVKASGGCAAPPAADAATQQAQLGRMAWRAVGPRPAAGQPWTVQWQLSHPNHSGLAMDPFTRQFTPAEFLRSLRLWQGDRPLLSGDLDFALSENPSLRWRFVPQGDAPLRAEAQDNLGRRFSGQVSLAELARSAWP